MCEASSHTDMSPSPPKDAVRRLWAHGASDYYERYVPNHSASQGLIMAAFGCGLKLSLRLQRTSQEPLECRQEQWRRARTRLHVDGLRKVAGAHFGALGVQHDGHVAAVEAVVLAHQIHHSLMALVVPVAHIQPRHIHALQI